MPGIGVRTSARILAEVSGNHFASAAHLVIYAEIAPVTRRSGTSTGGEQPSLPGNQQLKRAEGKRHNQAIIALARHSSDVPFAMLLDRTLYEDPAPRNLPSAT